MLEFVKVYLSSFIKIFEKRIRQNLMTSKFPDTQYVTACKTHVSSQFYGEFIFGWYLQELGKVHTWLHGRFACVPDVMFIQANKTAVIVYPVW